MYMWGRTLLVAVAVGLGAAGSVFVFHESFHDRLLTSLGLSHALGDALGTLFIFMVAYACQRLASVAVFHDWQFGMERLQAEAAGRTKTLVSAADQVAVELRAMQAFNDVVRGKLNGVVAETEKAACDIASRLQGIDGIISRLGAFVESTAAESKQLLTAAEERIERNRELISALENYIRQRVATAQEDRERIALVVKEASSLGSVVELIRHISGQTNLLALNAAIEAARAGEAGRGFAVVADEVRKLSGETDKAVGQISKGIQTVANSIESQFTDKLSADKATVEREALESFAVQLEDLGKSYKEVTEHEAAAMSTITDCSQKLAGMFMPALASVQFHDLTRQQIQQVIDALNRLDAHSTLLAGRLHQLEDPHFTLQPLAAHLAPMHGNHAMDSQRDTRPGATRSGSALTAGGPPIELF